MRVSNRWIVNTVDQKTLDQWRNLVRGNDSVIVCCQHKPLLMNKPADLLGHVIILSPFNRKNLIRAYKADYKHPTTGLRFSYPKYARDETVRFKVGVSNNGTLKHVDTNIKVSDIPVGGLWRTDQLLDHLYG